MEGNRAAFSNYNMVRMREAVRYFSPEKLLLFLKIPFYLHINSPDYPGFINTPSRANGIWRFEESGFYREAAANQYFPKSILETSKTNDPAILGFYHIGSLGTFTQSHGSDFDFWVIIDKNRFSKERYEALGKKLDDIVIFCREKHNQKVSFFIMDEKETRKNNYSPSMGEETITVPKIFLKEEFYRTFLMIAGKIPAWAVLPTYLVIDDTMKGQAMVRQIVAENEDLIDLGQIYKIPDPDILKGLLWHICKSKEDPVKALIKATMIFAHKFGSLQSNLLLCEKIKQGYEKAGIDDYAVDPYKTLFDEILLYHEQEDQKGIHLIKNAIFYRLCGYPQVKMPGVNSPKRRLLDKYIRTWSLNKNQVKKLLSYEQWSESEKLVLEKSIIKRLTQMVKEASKHLGTIEDFIKIDENSNWVILRNKTRERLGFNEKKVRTCSTFLRRKNITRLTVTEIDDSYRLNLRTNEGENFNGIYQHQYFSKVLGWVLENELYRRQHAIFEFNGMKSFFDSSDRSIDLDQIYLKFAPLKPLTDNPFEAEPEWSRAVVFLEYDWETIENGQLLVSNSWGEIVTEQFTLKAVNDKSDQIDAIVNHMVRYYSPNIRFHICQYAAMYDPEIVYQVKKAYNGMVLDQHELKKSKHKPLLDRL